MQMFFRSPQFVASCARTALIVFAVSALCAAGNGKASNPGQHAQAIAPDIQYMATTPLGTDEVRLVPSGQVLTMLVTLESKELDGVRLTRTNSMATLKDRDGKDVTHFPPELTFRVTVGSKTKLIDHEPMDTEFDGTAHEFEETLQFRLKIFHGVDQVELDPEWQKIIGVPLEMPYDERIYRVRFKLPEQMPATDRVMLEVIDSEGERVGKFSVQML